MSDFCDFVPDDPSCQVEDPVDNGNPAAGGKMGDDGDMHGDDMHGDDHGNPMMANMVFLQLALGGAVHSGLKLFRYTTDTYYDWGTANDTLTNFWEYNHMVSNYWMLFSHTVLFITQALSMAGIAGEVNLMAWMYFNMASMVVGMLITLFRMYAIDTYYTASEDDSDATAQAYAAVVLASLETDILEETALKSAAMLMAYMYYKDWMHAQVMALPEEVQGKYKQGHGKEEHHDEGMEKMQEFGLFVI